MIMADPVAALKVYNGNVNKGVYETFADAAANVDITAALRRNATLLLADIQPRLVAVSPADQASLN